MNISTKNVQLTTAASCGNVARLLPTATDSIIDSAGNAMITLGECPSTGQRLWNEYARHTALRLEIWETYD